MLSLGLSAKDGASGACPTFSKLAIADEYHDNEDIFLPLFPPKLDYCAFPLALVNIACCSIVSLIHHEPHNLSSPRHVRLSSRTPHPTTNTSSAQCQQQ
jgi:hypothetical protein